VNSRFRFRRLMVFSSVLVLVAALCGGGVLWGATDQSVGLSKAPKPGKLNVSKSLNFGGAKACISTKTKNLKIKNAGGLTVNFSASPSLGGSSFFSIDSNDCGTTLAPKQKCVISLTFNPEAPGKVTGTLTLPDDAINGPQQIVQLKGNGKGNLSCGSAPPSAGTPVSALGVSVTGEFAPPTFSVATPTAFPTPTASLGSEALASPVRPVGVLARVDSWLGTLVSHWWKGVGAAPALAASGYIAVYAPLGSYGEDATGVALMQVAGSGVKPGVVATPDTVNSCASVPPGTFVSGSTNPEAVCVSNDTDVYLIDGTKLEKTLTSAGTGTFDFSGGSCTTCGVAVDPISMTAVIAIAGGPSGEGGYQLLNLKTQAFTGTADAAPDGLAENYAVMPISSDFFLILSPTEDGQYDIFGVVPPSGGSGGGAEIAEYNGGAINPPYQEFDSPALDSTGIILGTSEFTNNIFLADLTQATVNTGSVPWTWNAASQLQTLPSDWDSFTAGTTGIAVAYGEHLAFLEDEFGLTAFGALQLPSASGSGTPAVLDSVVASMPFDPSGELWAMPLDPHGLAAAFASAEITGGAPGTPGTVVLGSGAGIGLVMNDQRTYVAVVDLGKLLAAPREATSGFGSNTVDPSYDLVANNVVTFVPFP
jgi:Abnormal spindle-like microcephaly-assoc'd, ASPM-SPD-2-Hydin